MGYISVLITELNLVLNYKRNMLMSTECCGMPLFANAVAAKCRQCEKLVPLRINPKIVSRKNPTLKPVLQHVASYDGTLARGSTRYCISERTTLKRCTRSSHKPLRACWFLS
jgi:hypothetical protein